MTIAIKKKPTTIQISHDFVNMLYSNYHRQNNAGIKPQHAFGNVLLYPSLCPRKTAMFIIFLSLLAFYVLWSIDIIFNFVDSNVQAVILSSSHWRSTKSTIAKYILIWQNNYYIFSKGGKHSFDNLQCSVSNCVFTTNKSFYMNYKEFDAVIFNEHSLREDKRPENRSQSQIYIFMSIESSHIYPACETYHDDYFNWTFTHRLDSDIVWKDFVVYNLAGDEVAPSYMIKWNTSSDPVRSEIKSILVRKKKLAAWIVSHCSAVSYREEYLSILQEHLAYFNMKIDIFGQCTNKTCDGDDCEEMLKENYYFYMAFENSFAEDYVTEKVLHGYNNYAVPVVYGTANYNRFLPPGSYINARQMHPVHLASSMHSAMVNPVLFENYFRWTNLYSIEPRNNYSLCDLCAALHGDKASDAPPKKTFRFWWNAANGMQWCLYEYWKDFHLNNYDPRVFFKFY